MNIHLTIGAVLAFGIGLAHSYLGERYILIRLFKRGNLPHLFGSDDFTRRTLRFVWHVTTIAWWGLGAVMVVYAAGQIDQPGPGGPRGYGTHLPGHGGHHPRYHPRAAPVLGGVPGYCRSLLVWELVRELMNVE